MTSAQAPRALRWLRVRLYVVALALAGLLGTMGYKAWTLQVRDHARMKTLGEAQYRQRMIIAASRGMVRDRNGAELAISVDGASVDANPREVVDVAGTAARLAKALGLDGLDDVMELEEKLASGRRFVWIARRVTDRQAAAVRALGLPGVHVVAEPRRMYPGGSLAGPLLGVADLDGRGIDGLELALDEELRGERAILPALRDARGALVLANGWSENGAPAGELAEAGASVTLTIDRFIQFSAERALAEAITEHQARAGVVIVLDPATGEVLALASHPTFDPNQPGDRRDARNRAVTDAFEPGSVMKVFTIAAAIDQGAVGAGDVFDVEGGRLQVGRKLVLDTHKGEHLLTVSDIMKVSSNVGAVKIARKLGKDGVAAGLRRFGFGSRTGIELPGERAGRIRPVDTWGEIGLATAAYGYGYTTTPLQIAAALAAVANGGRWLAPALVKRVNGPGGKLVREHVPEPRRALSEETARAVSAMLETVVHKGGTAEKVRVPGYALAGKTGTAHKVDPATGRYAPDKYLSSFIGYAPARDPRVVIVVMIDEPGGSKHFGGAVAGPVFARVAREAMEYLGVPPSEPVAEAAGEPPPARRGAAAREPAAEPEPVPPEPEEPADLPVAGPGEPIVVIPDFRGLSVGEALSAARAAGVVVDVVGSGRAVRQFPGPGRALKSITCRVTFDPG